MRCLNFTNYFYCINTRLHDNCVILLHSNISKLCSAVDKEDNEKIWNRNKRTLTRLVLPGRCAVHDGVMMIRVLQGVILAVLAGILAVILNAVCGFHQRIHVKISSLYNLRLQRKLLGHVVHHGPLSSPARVLLHSSQKIRGGVAGPGPGPDPDRLRILTVHLSCITETEMI